MEPERILLKGHIVSPEGDFDGRGLVEITGGTITFVGEGGTSMLMGQKHRIYDFGPNYICPGLIDLHIHGSGGCDVMDATSEALNRISCLLAQGGATSFLATLMSAPHQELTEAIRNIAKVMQKGTDGAQILGAHLEGPFLNAGKRGAHKEENLRLPNINKLKDYIDAGNGSLKMITLAPELLGAAVVIEYAKSRGLLVSLGHSDASITQVYEACEAGLSHVTHAFNAMAKLHHRDPGTTGAILSMKKLTVDIIPDGNHVHPVVIKILVCAKGVDSVCAISDCTRAGQMGDGVFELGGQKITVKQGISHLEDGTLSGSVINMAQGLRILVEKVGVSLPEAVQMASTNPARILGLQSKGALKLGYDADIVIFDRRLDVLMTMVAGKIVHRVFDD